MNQEQRPLDPQEQELLLTLVKKGLLTKNQCDVIKRECDQSPLPLRLLLIQNGFIDEDVLSGIIGEVFGVESIDLDKTIPETKALNIIPKSLALQHKCFPISVSKEHTLHLAMVNPYDIVSLDRIRQHTSHQFKIQTLTASESQILAAIDSYYDQDMSLHLILEDLHKRNPLTSYKEKSSPENARPIVKLVQTFIVEAVSKRASDIHFEPEEMYVRVRMRIDGVMHPIVTFHKDYWSSVSIRLKILSELNITETRLPQNGRFTLHLFGRSIDFRLSTHPTINGESIVLRILDKRTFLKPLDQIGFQDKLTQVIKKFLKEPSGLLIVTGPTGSGKTTTLYSLLMEIASPEVNCMTLEQPVEYHLPFVRQTAIQENGLLTFADGIRSILRQDPDVIFVGEIRDADTANMAIRASMTGHKVLTTLHTNDVFGVIPRLLELGVPAPLLGANLRLVLSQKLLRCLCHACEGSGCSLCDTLGFKGRIPLAELLEVDETLQSLIEQNANSTALKTHADRNGYIPIEENAKYLLEHGYSSREEIMRHMPTTKDGKW